jgi:hypothetical protein
MKTRCLLILMLMLSLTGCRKQSEELPAEDPWADWKAAGIYWESTVDVPAVERLVAFFAKDMYDLHRIELEDSCVLRDEKSIYRFNLSFSSQRLITLCEARLLLVDVVDEFIKRVNNHTIISFQINAFPLTEDSVDININFESFGGIFIDPLYIGKAQLWDSSSYFYAFNNKNPDADWSQFKFERFYKSRQLARFKQEAEMEDSETILRGSSKSKSRTIDASAQL